MIVVIQPPHRCLLTADINTMASKKTSIKIKELQREIELHDKQLARAVDYARKHPKEPKVR